MSRRRNLLLKNGNRIPRAGLLAYFRESGGTMVDTIGSSTITFTVGDASDIVNSTFQFDYNATMASVDTDLGGGVLFSDTTPIAREYLDWCSLVNQEFLFVGNAGVSAYDTAQNFDIAQRIRAYLRCPSMMLDSLEMIDGLRMI